MRMLTAIPAVRLNDRKLQIRVRLFWSLLIAASSLGVLSLAAWVLNAPQPAAPAQAVPWGSAVAETAARQFLTGQSYTVPLAKDLDMPAVAPTDVTVSSVTLERSRELAIPMSRERGTYRYELDTFLAVTSSGTFRVTVSTTRTESGSVALAAMPSLEPVRTSGTADDLDYADLVGGTDVPTAVSARVQAWATAFAASGPSNASAEQTLREMTGRNDLPAGSRPGLNGAYTVVSAQVVGKATPVTTNQTAQEGIGVRVRLALAPASAQKSPVYADYDLVVLSTKLPLPRIAAWGPAGSLASLLDR